MRPTKWGITLSVAVDFAVTRPLRKTRKERGTQLGSKKLMLVERTEGEGVEP